MEVREITDQKELNGFVMLAAGGQFLQSWEWGQFQQEMGRQVWRWGVWDDRLLSVMTVVENKLPLSLSYLYVPYGPVFRDGLSDRKKEEIIKLFLSKGRDITVRTKTRLEVFFRLEPRLSSDDLGNFFFNLGLKSTDAVQPRDTQVIDLSLSEFRLMQAMHQKTRYNIRLAEKHGVQVRIGETEKDREIFWILMQLTAARDNFHSHPRNYYEKMLVDFSHTDINDQARLTTKLLVAEKNGQPLAVGIFSFFGDRVMYLHGASSNQNRQLMASYLLQWRAMQLAKENYYHLFDLNGVAPTERNLGKGDKENKWSGITRFKKGFGGQEVNYVGAWDWVYAKIWYEVYRLGRKIL